MVDNQSLVKKVFRQSVKLKIYFEKGNQAGSLENKKKGVMEMELTYENIKEMAQKYFDSLPSIEGPQDAGRIREFFAPDFKLRSGNPMVIRDREQWIEHLCGHADVHRVVRSYQPPPLGIWIDEDKKVAFMVVAEEYKHPVTKENVSPKVYLAETLEFCVHDNKVKARREMALRIPGTELLF